MQSEPLRNAYAMCVNDYGRLAENIAAHKVCGLSADSRQFNQIVNIIGHNSAEIVTQHFCKLNNVP